MNKYDTLCIGGVPLLHFTAEFLNLLVMLKVYYPFYSSFQCMGGECPINCCQFCHLPLLHWEERLLDLKPEWQDIDGKGNGFKHYLRQENGSWMLRSEGGYCVLMDTDKLCSIQKRYGDAALPSVCRTFPRLITAFPDRVEYGFDLCCPVATYSLKDWKVGEFVDGAGVPVTEYGRSDAKCAARQKVMDAFADEGKTLRECLGLISSLCVRNVDIPQFSLDPSQEAFVRKASSLMFWSYMLAYDGFPGVDSVADVVLRFLLEYIPTLCCGDFWEMSVHFSKALSDYVQRTGFDLEIEGRYHDSSELL